jgi:hypothetical protein
MGLREIGSVNVRCEVLMAVKMSMLFIWDVSPCEKILFPSSVLKNPHSIATQKNNINRLFYRFSEGV